MPYKDREKGRENKKEYRLKNKEKFKKWGRKYRENNKDKLKQQHKKYYQENIEKFKKYREINRERIKRYGEKYGEKYFRNNKCKLKKQHKKYYEENKNILSKKYKIYREKNKIYIRKWMKKYQLENKENLNKKALVKRKIRRTKDIGFKIRSYLSTRLWFVLKKYTKTGKIISSKDYGIDYKSIIKHLQPFPKDIKNYHVDHIIPLSLFDFNNHIHIKKAFAPENHQWLTIEENLSKGNKLIIPH